jgi:hypothetical protein
LAWFALKLSCVFAALREILRVQKLGKNLGGYHGETIDIRALLQEIEVAAQSHGWTVEVFHQIGDLRLFALHRRPESGGPRPKSTIYISAGIHGDEPAGPLAVLRLLRENHWPDNAEIILLPCLNPIGFTLNRRENAEGIDLNRDYRNSKSAEIREHFAWLERQPRFNLYLCLHEDWESHGFYLYEQNPDNRRSLAEPMIEAVSKMCPIDPNELIEGRPAKGGIIRPNLDPASRPQWPEAFYMIMHKTRRSYTLEAPSDYPLSTRVDGLVAAVNAGLTALATENHRNAGIPVAE